MLFPTFEFFLFFTLVLIFNWILKKWPFWWEFFLLFISYYFYLIWGIKPLSILIFTSLLNYFFGYLIYKDFFKIKNFFLLLSIVFNLFILGVFKYYDFFRLSLETLLKKFNFAFTFPLLEIILPVGLSFYIFKAISFNIDIYQRKINEYPSLLDSLLHFAFFPYLLSGPIVRINEFLPQLKNGGAKEIENFHYYFALIFFGLFKKLIISSWLSLIIVEDVFAVPENYSFFTLFLAAISFFLLIYFDFSSYSDLAIGFAGLMGFKTPLNFNFPYLASNLKEFWRRWHITLSNWVRDYVYIPLGGNKKGKLRKYSNLMIAMFLIGLWHGASPNFIFWGVLQGIGLILTHFLIERGFSLKGKISHFLTLSFISFSWIFFKANDIERAGIFLKNFFFPQRLFEPIKLYLLILIFGALIFCFLERKFLNFSIYFLKRQAYPILIFLTIFIVIIIFKLAPDTVPSFIYFSF